jgi:hypothetical protein
VYKMSVDELLSAVDDLNEKELEHLVRRVLWIQARRKAPILAPEETQLLLEINKGIPAELSQRYQILRDRRDDEALTESEQSEIIRLCDEMENIGVKRLEALTRLADLRQVSLLQLMSDLGIQGAGYN